MASINRNYLKLPGSYLFSTIGKKVREYSAAHPEAKIIRLGIGDVTQPLCEEVIGALHKAVDEMASPETFKGYAPDLGYEFLRNVISEKDNLKSDLFFTVSESPRDPPIINVMVL